jgi:hypothetical protein
MIGPKGARDPNLHQNALASVGFARLLDASRARCIQFLRGEKATLVSVVDDISIGTYEVTNGD